MFIVWMALVLLAKYELMSLQYSVVDGAKDDGFESGDGQRLLAMMVIGVVLMFNGWNCKSMLVSRYGSMVLMVNDS